MVSTLTKISEDEYLEKEFVAFEKSEYFDGIIIPMAGVSYDHDGITTELLWLFKNFARKYSFRVFSCDMRVCSPLVRTYFYPDISLAMADNEEFDEKSKCLLNPVLLIEVLSGSTEMYDKREKWKAFRAIESLKEYWFVAQDSPYIEQFTKNNQGEWVYKDYSEMEAVVECKIFPISLQLRDIYAQVRFKNQ